MSLMKEQAIKRIERYLQRNDSHPRLVNIDNSNDLHTIQQYFSVGDNVFKSVADFSKNDGSFSEDALYGYLQETQDVVFLTGFTSYYRLLGKEKLQDFINHMLGMSISGMHLVVLCYQCKEYLTKVDPRYSQFVYLIEGQKDPLPQLVFISPSMPIELKYPIVEGIQNFTRDIENSLTEQIFVRTKKRKSNYPCSLFSIKEWSNAYGVLCDIDIATNYLKENFGTKEEWARALSEVSLYGSWKDYVMSVFGTTTNLENLIGSWTTFNERKKWLYFIALKLYGAKNSWCLTEAIRQAENGTLFIRCVFRSLLNLSPDDKEFWNHYNERKRIIRVLENPDSEVSDYCAVVKQKEQDALYYLTDASKREKNLIFENLANYSEKIGRDNVVDILRHVYPDLCSYLQPYHFKVSSFDLDTYFQEYKYQKVVNKIYPEFLNRVKEQAEKREYNLYLPARSEKLDALEKDGTAVYFMDAMGVEYLSYIMERCWKKNLLASTTICHCELPSITAFNKEFVDVFTQGGADFIPSKNGIKSLDDLKHHGTEEFDFTNNEIPTYIATELDIISKVVEQIATLLDSGKYKRVVMLSDHGASRLCVLAKSENRWGSKSNAEHSGRCCPVNEIEHIPSCATQENGYWVLANYDRFKGGRKANIEVHGGATLEEVVVPIIEIVKAPIEVEIQLLSKVVKFSRRKKNAVIKIFSKTKLDNLSIRVSKLNGEFEGKSTDGQTFTVELPELRKADKYTLDVFYNNNLLKSGLEFTAESIDFGERKLL